MGEFRNTRTEYSVAPSLRGLAAGERQQVRRHLNHERRLGARALLRQPLLALAARTRHSVEQCQSDDSRGRAVAHVVMENVEYLPVSSNTNLSCWSTLQTGRASAAITRAARHDSASRPGESLPPLLAALLALPVALQLVEASLHGKREPMRETANNGRTNLEKFLCSRAHEHVRDHLQAVPVCSHEGERLQQ